MTASLPESSEASHEDEPGTDLLKRVAMTKAGIRKIATEGEVGFIDALSKAAGEDVLGGVLPAAKEYIKAIEGGHLAKNIVLLAGTLPMAMVIHNANLFTFLFLVLWIVIGAKVIAFSQARQQIQVEGIIEALQKLNTANNKK